MLTDTLLECGPHSRVNPARADFLCQRSMASFSANTTCANVIPWQKPSLQSRCLPSGPVTRDDTTVDVKTYRLPRSARWTLEVVDHEAGTTAWKRPSTPTKLAYRIFTLALNIEGVRSFAEAPKVQSASSPLASLSACRELVDAWD